MFLIGDEQYFKGGVIVRGTLVPLRGKFDKDKLKGRLSEGNLDAKSVRIYFVFGALALSLL